MAAVLACRPQAAGWSCGSRGSGYDDTRVEDERLQRDPLQRDPRGPGAMK
jgi:hypothetical protein